MTPKLTVEIESGSLVLEGRFRPAPTGAKGSPAALLCHPHPQFGGSMDNNVIYALEQGFTDQGIATLIFNFRGVGQSQGRYDNMKGEVDDVIAALLYLARRPEIDAGRIVLAGYSFGGLMALLALSRLLSGAAAKPRTGENFRPCALVLASPMPPARSWQAAAELKAFFASPCPTLVIAGTADRFCPVKSAQELIVLIGPQARLALLEGGDHFYGGLEDQAAQHAADFLAGQLSVERS